MRTRRKLIALMMVGGSVSAQEQLVLPVIVGLKGEAQVLSKDATDQPTLLYEGEKYHYRKAKVGMKMAENSLLLCAPDCRVKLVYPSGSSLYVAPGTALQITKMEVTPRGEDSVLNLMYGKIRALVSKKKTSTLKVKTPAVTAGVRGTDFTAHHGLSQGSQVAVLSGRVEVSSVQATPEAKPVVLKAQQSAISSEAEVKVEALTKAQVLAAHEITTVPVVADTSEVQELEARSKATVIDEFKSSQPKRFQQLKDVDSLSVEELNRKLIEAPLKRAKASSGSARVESFEKDLENYKNQVDKPKEKNP